MVATDPGEGAATTGRYRFDDIVVDAAAHTVLRAGELQAVEPKAFAVLLALLQRPGELIGRDELLDRVWGHRHVTPGVLTRAIAQLRHALDDDSQRPRYIQTQHAVGYRFVGALEADRSPAAEARQQEAETLAPPGIAAPLNETGPGDSSVLDRRTGSPDRLDTSADLATGAGMPRTPPGATRRRWVLGAGFTAAVAIAAWLFVRNAAPPARPEASIAVLPFTTLSNDRSDNYFAEGLAVEMHDALAGVQGLKVAARMTPTVADRGEPDVKALGKRLGVATVLDASVRREGDRVRINARLSDCVSGYTLWSRSYDRELSDVFATQSEIADEVLRSLMGVLPEKREALTKRLTPTKNVAAFDAYLRGLQQLLRADSKGSEERASGFFNQALAADGRFARAQAGICRSEVFRFEHYRVAEAFEHARKACARAKALDPDLSEVNLALAKLHHARGDLGAAIEYYAKAEIDPARRPDVYMGLALLHGEQGRHARALEYLEQAIEMSPGNAVVHSYSGYYHYLAGDLRQSIASYRKAVELQPRNEGYWSTLGAIYASAGSNAAGVRALEKSIQLKPSYAALSNLGELKYQAGEYAAAADLHRRATVLEPADYIPWGNLANALLADPASTRQARVVFQKAAERAQRYVEIKSNDAIALAALGWFRANLGQADQARELVRRSEELRGEPMEIALFNAQTLAVLGDIGQARQRIAAARAAGLPETRIKTNVVLRRAGIASAPPASRLAASPAPSNDEGHPPGE